MKAKQSLHLPHADGVLPEHPVQWWYWSGHLRTEAGDALGFQLAFFAGEAVPGLLWGQMAHCAIAEPALRRCARQGRLWVGAPLRVEGRFALESPCKTMRALGGDGRELLHVEVGEEQLDLRLEAQLSPVIHYDGGCHRYAFGGHSYHYSRPSIHVRGTYRRPGGKNIGVEGQAWFDRQIGVLAPLLLSGWQWFAIQFRSGGSLMVFDFNGAREERFAVEVSARGDVETFAHDRIDIEPLEQWQSRKTGVRYPHTWRIRSPKHDLHVLPRFSDQEMAGWFAPAYWEGSCDVSGSHPGDAYAELVGGVPNALQAPRAEQPSSWLRAQLAHPVMGLAIATGAGALGRHISLLTPRFPFVSSTDRAPHVHRRVANDAALHRTQP